MQPDEITREAVGKHCQEIALKLDCNPSWVYRICGGPEHDPYTKFTDLYDAVAEKNPPGADLFYNDFAARHQARKKQKAQQVIWEVAVANAMRITQDALAEAATDGKKFRVKALKAIEALQFLLAQEKRDGNV